MEGLARGIDNPLVFKYVEDNECPICLNPLRACIVLDCHHQFHLPCIQEWSRLQNTEICTCPICRRPLETPFQQARALQTTILSTLSTQSTGRWLQQPGQSPPRPLPPPPEHPPSPRHLSPPPPPEHPSPPPYQGNWCCFA